MSALYRRFRDRADFFAVYIREAHPEDGWVLSSNRAAGIAVADPADDGERVEVATTCSTVLRFEFPMLVDGADDLVARQYGAWPDRLYLIGADGTVVYQGGPGPFGFRVEELERALEEELRAG